MGFKTGAYATVWEVVPSEKFTKIRISTSHKNKDTGEYDQDFSGYVGLFGDAGRMANKLKVRDRIKLGDVDVRTTYNKTTKQEYVNYNMYTFDIVPSLFNGEGNEAPVQRQPQQQAQNRRPNPAQTPMGDANDSDYLPF